MCLLGLPRDPMITTVVYELVLNTRQNSLLCFNVDSPSTEETREVIYEHSNLRTL